MIKKSIVCVALFSAPLFAMAAATGSVCDGTTSKKVAVTHGTGEFIKTNFDAQCSSNVHLAYNQTAVVIAVGSASAKGKSIFGGSSEGGAVTKLSTGGDCAASGCTAGDATTAAANSMPSS